MVLAADGVWMLSIFTPLTSEREYTKWVAGDRGLAFVVAAVVAVVFWLKRGDLPTKQALPQPVFPHKAPASRRKVTRHAGEMGNFTSAREERRALWISSARWIANLSA
jgi:hypothetical protein